LLERSHQHQNDQILSVLNSHGSMARGLLRQRFGGKQKDLGIILDELEEEGKIKRTRLRNGRRGAPSELISLITQ
jgi:DNA-binding MarR family transcriptional regulator